MAAILVVGLIAQLDVGSCDGVKTISGTIRWPIDQGGGPVPNVLLRAISQGDPNLFAETVTDSNGLYKFFVPRGWSGTIAPVGIVDPNVAGGAGVGALQASVIGRHNGKHFDPGPVQQIAFAPKVVNMAETGR
jgi:hypothetical protein